MAEYSAYVNDTIDDDQILVTFDIHIPPSIDLNPDVIIQAIYDSISNIPDTTGTPTVTKTVPLTTDVTPA